VLDRCCVIAVFIMFAGLKVYVGHAFSVARDESSLIHITIGGAFRYNVVNMAFNEDSRVKIPAILHLQRLGYEYLSLKDSVIDESTNIFTEVFSKSLKEINPGIEDEEIERVFTDLSLELDNDDLGKAFYQRLVSQAGNKLIDFENFNKNTFNVVTELTYRNGDEEFRPDITVLINGMPLVFIEVKKPNNHEGILAERNRINVRFKNKRFKKFVNITQLLIFSNNMEYDDSGVNPLPGAFYATTAKGNDVKFNNFREDSELDLGALLRLLKSDDEDFVLKDNNQQVIKHSPEFITNKNPNTPTNRILTSLLSRGRLEMLLRFAVAYVDDPETGIQKHIMRYPQLFATKAIEKKLDQSIDRGIIWHTQGSGKTALAYYNVHYLTHYFKKKGVIPKFYFIVDRLDLLTQASTEFTNRGLIVRNVNSKEEFASEFKQAKAIHGLTGKPEITVVNIQKFKDDTRVIEKNDYDISVQRIYFLDEAHRSYDPTGSFLANLYDSDRSSIKIALTGTPLIVHNEKKASGKEDSKTTRSIFGNYIHKYYYNASIADGYTLRLIREGIESNYQIELESILKEIEIKYNELDKKQVYSHRRFVEPMLDYIIKDFLNSRIRFGDDSMGAMVVCASSEQARMMHEIFEQRYPLNADTPDKLTSALILHDEGTKEERTEKVELFKKYKKIDILFVYNMLLTGFDANRLKKLYLGRVIKSHNLLQTLTRVNRPYRSFQYGFVVDFANISKEFDATNRAYFEELNREYGDDLDGESEQDVFGGLFKSSEEIEQEIAEIKDKLFSYDIENAEVFTQQINQIDDRKKILELKKLLENARNLYNMVKLFGHYDLFNRIDFRKLNILFNEVSRRLDLLNLKENMQTNTESRNILNAALEDIIFSFKKTSEEELKIADEIKGIVRKARGGLSNNFDPADPYYVSLYEEFKRLFEKCNISELTQDEMRENMKQFESLYSRIRELNRNNENLRAKYEGDAKYARTHKRLKEQKLISDRDSAIFKVLMSTKSRVDNAVHDNQSVIENPGYFSGLVLQKTVNSFDESSVNVSYEAADTIQQRLTKEYVDEYNGVTV
jgi:type I restriction enzyme, R subunit